MKKIISILLCLFVIIGCFSGCSQEETSDDRNESKKSNKKNQSGLKTESLEDVLGFDKTLAKTLTNAVIMRMESMQAFVDGCKTQLSEVPFAIDDVQYIPGGFVTKGLGGTAETDEELWNLKLKKNKWSVNVQDGTVEKGGSNVELKHPVIGLEQDFMISTEDYSQITGMESMAYDDLILVGDRVNGVFDDLPEEGSDMMTGILNNHLSMTPVSGMTGQNRDNWDRRDVSHNIDIDPWCIPYTSPEGYLVAVSGDLYVEDLTFSNHPTDESYYVCSMTVYNMGLTYAAAESYSADNKLIDRDMVEPYGGRYESVISAVTNSAIMIGGTVKWITTGDMSEVEYKIPSSQTRVSLNVPRDGYVFLTSNPQYSKSVAAFNTVLLYGQVLACTTGINPLVPDGSPLLRNMIVNCAISAIHEDSAVIEELADIFYQFTDAESEINQLDSEEYIKEVCKRLQDAVKKADYDLEDLMDDALDTAIAELEDTVDATITDAISYVPAVGQALEIIEIYADSERLLGMCHQLSITQNTTPIVFSACDWRTAYAKLLREYSFPDYGVSGPKFALCYIDANSVPELVVMEGASLVSQAYVFSYRNGEILARKDKAPAYYGCMSYYEFGDVQVAYSLNRGYEGLSWRRFLIPEEGDSYIFNNDYFAVGENEKEATYRYQEKEVSKWYYDYMIQKVENKYSKYEKIALDYGDCYEITEGNIRMVIEKK